MTGNDDNKRRGRHLRAEERALWRDVTRSVAPLRGAAKAIAADAEPLAGHDAPPEPAPRAAAPIKRRETSVSKPAPALAPLGQRFRRKLARGTEAIDARIDLHGMTQREAHGALVRFLHRAQADGCKIVLVITGKGTRGDDGTRERGVLRRQVPLWLKLPELRAIVVSCEEAHIGHGGEGALYVRVRRGGV